MTVIEALEDALHKLIAARGRSCECPEDNVTACYECRYREMLALAQKDKTTDTSHQEKATMSLGQTLGQQIARNKAEQIAEQERIARETDAKKRRNYEKVEQYLKEVREKLTEQVLGGKTKPSVSTRNERKIEWLFHESTGDKSFIGTDQPGICYAESPYHPLWLDTLAWAEENDLDLTARYEHDGCGMESWYVFQIAPKDPS